MGLGELTRLVEEAEHDPALRRSLRRCRSRLELVLAARRLGYAIHREDLRRAWLLDRPSRQHGGVSDNSSWPPARQLLPPARQLLRPEDRL
jgi:hypothetical protein